MKLQPGKYYRTKAGRKVGPMLYEDGTWHEPTTEQVWHGDGTVMQEDGDESHDYIVAEWEDYIPKRWRDMTAEEKGALLLAHHEGKVIEVRAEEADIWYKRDTPNWVDKGIFRVRSERETVELYDQCMTIWSDSESHDAEYRITFDLIDGIPDTTSIRMEQL